MKTSLTYRISLSRNWHSNFENGLENTWLVIYTFAHQLYCHILLYIVTHFKTINFELSRPPIIFTLSLLFNPVLIKMEWLALFQYLTITLLRYLIVWRMTKQDQVNWRLGQRQEILQSAAFKRISNQIFLFFFLLLLILYLSF